VGPFPQIVRMSCTSPTFSCSSDEWPICAPARTLEGHRFTVTSVSLAPGPCHLIIHVLCMSSKGRGTIFGASSLRAGGFVVDSPFSIRLCADGRSVCSGSRDTALMLWDVETGRRLTAANIEQNVVSLAWQYFRHVFHSSSLVCPLERSRHGAAVGESAAPSRTSAHASLSRPIPRPLV